MLDYVYDTITMMKRIVLPICTLPLPPSSPLTGAAAEFGLVIYQVGHQRKACTIPYPCPAFVKHF